MTGSSGPDPLLWRDPSVFLARYEKSAAALIAIARTLEARPDLCPGAREFGEDYAALAASDAADFTAVWRDPYAYYWMRVAFELLGALVRGEPPSALAANYAGDVAAGDPRAALSFHLGQFKRLVLGACLRAGRTIAFRTPLELALPAAIPGMRFSALGDGAARVSGCTAGAPTGEGLRLEECPVVACEDLELLLQPHTFHIPGIPYWRGRRNRDFAFQREHADLLASALDVMRRFDPDSFAQWRAVMRMVALQSGDDVVSLSNLSHSDLPGTVLICPTAHPYYMADVLIHELHHHRLFFLEEREPFLADQPDDPESEARYCSPWREDLRPLHGLLHGAYVFVPVVRYWIRVASSADLDAGTRLLARDRVARGAGQLRIGLHQLRRHARLTPFGETLLASLEAHHRELVAALRAAGLPEDSDGAICHDDGTVTPALHPDEDRPVRVRELLTEHVRRFAPADQAADLLRHAL